MTRIRRSGPPPQGAAPILANTDTHHSTGYFDSSLDLARAAAVLADAGLAVAGRCVDCGQAIVSPTSLARMRGPRCAAKARAVVE